MKYLFLLLASCVTYLSFSQDKFDLNQKIPTDEKVKIGHLENGLTYYIQKNSKPENKVELRLVVNAGSILETEEQRGLAHFMEHMNFNGTKNFQHNELVDYLQGIGVKFGQHLNAYTSFDETVYILPIPSDDKEKLDKGFDILEDWAFNCLLTPEEIEKERGVVLEEMRIGLGADKRMRDNYLPLLMYDSQYAKRLPIGLKSVIENFDHKELEDFYKSWYRPDLMAVVVVGDIDIDEMQKQIEEHFGKYENPKNEKERTEFLVPDHQETFVAIERDPEASFTQVQLVYKDKGRPDKIETVGDYRKSMVIQLFSTMLNNRLGEIGNNPNPPFTFGYTYHGSGWSRNKASYTCVSMTDPENQLRAFETLVDENERVLRYGFNEGELGRAKKSMMSRMEAAVKNKDKVESRRIASSYVSNFLKAKPIPGVEYEYNAYQALMDDIEISEINELINSFIHDDNRVVVFTGPESDVPAPKEKEVLDILKKVKEKDLEPYEDNDVPTSLMTQMPKAGEVVSNENLEDVEMNKLVLSNGVTVYYKKTDFNDNQILMSAFSPGGSSLLSAEVYLKTNLAMSGVNEAGLNGFDLNEMTKIMAGKNASVTAMVGSNFEYFDGRTVNKDVEDMFQLIYLNFTSINKNKEAYQSYVDKQSAFMGNLMNTPQYWFMNEKMKVEEKNNPRFTQMIPSKEEWESQDYDLAYELYLDRFSDASDFTFVFVGSLNEEEIVKYSEMYLASLPSTNRGESYVDHSYERLKGKNEFTFNKGTDPKSMVEISFRTEKPYDAKQAYFIKSLAEVLTIKLVENLREGESGVYGVGARGSASKIPTGVYEFSISFPCGPENAEKLKEAALMELNKIVKDGPTQKDLDKVKEAQRLELKENLKSNRYWLRQVSALLRYERPVSDILEKEKWIEDLSAKDLKNAANAYIGDDMNIFILMPEE